LSDNPILHWDARGCRYRDGLAIENPLFDGVPGVTGVSENIRGVEKDLFFILTASKG
jgi:hypothetical protein